MLSDWLGRKVTYLRISLTARCNLRCGYCYGSPSANWSDRRDLSDSDVLRLIRIFATLGINKIRFTGGEPLLRRELVSIARETASVDGVSLIALSTNGLLLSSKLDSLVKAGLNRLNVSLDTLDRATFTTLTGVDGLERVRQTIEDAAETGAFPRVKVNTVVMRGINDEEIATFVRWALPRRIDIRFIEFMPTKKSGWNRNLFVSENEIREKVGLPLQPDESESNSSGPAQTFKYRSYPGRISFISAVSRSFCNSCNRLRLTSSGELVGCLFLGGRVQLKAALQSGASDIEIAQYLSEIVARPAFRRIPSESSTTTLEPSMRLIGG